MSEGALRLIRRTAFGKEGTTIYTAPGAFTNPRGLEDFELTWARESLEDSRHTTSRKANYAPHVGEKSGGVSFRVPAHADLVGDLDVVFESAFGKKSANTNPTFSTGNDGTVTVSAGTPDPIVLCTANSILYARPVKSFAANVATFAIKLPASATTIANASQNNGALYHWDPTADTVYWRVQADRDAEADEIPMTLTGGVTTQLELTLDLAQRLGFTIAGEFHDWTQEAGADLADPDGALSGHLLSYAGEAFIQDAGTPTTGTQLDVLTLSVNLVPEWIKRRAMRAPGANVPGSSVVGVKQGRFCVDGLRVTLTKSDATWVTRRGNRTALWGFFSWSLGGPAASTTADKIALSFPRLVLSADPTPVDVDGIEGVELAFTVEEDTALTAPYNAPALGIFSAA